MNLTVVYAVDDALTRIEIAPGVYTCVDLTQQAGKAVLYEKNGTTVLTDYRITQANGTEYIIFSRASGGQCNTRILEPSNIVTHYWKSGVVRTYPNGTYAPSIHYWENGPYGYASGQLYWYAQGRGIRNPEYTDVWYEGYLYCDGAVSPDSLE